MFNLWDFDAQAFTEPTLPATLTLSDFERRELTLLTSGLPVADWSVKSEIESLTLIQEVPPSVPSLAPLGQVLTAVALRISGAATRHTRAGPL
jgi:hypothetical protein